MDARPCKGNKNNSMITEERIKQLIEKGNTVLSTYNPDTISLITLDSGQFTGWRTQALHYLRQILPINSQYILSFEADVKKANQSSAEKGIGILQSINEDLKLGLLNLTINDSSVSDPASPLFNIFDKFHLLVRQLRSRHNSRDTLDVKDEYDVQDFFHTLLHLYYDDIRPEEWTPSYAGKSARMDFLLKDLKIVIEIKKTRNGLTTKELGSQLIEDIARYKVHPDCESLICFTYDPEGLIGNPRGLESDLSSDENGMNVKVIIRP